MRKCVFFFILPFLLCGCDSENANDFVSHSKSIYQSVKEDYLDEAFSNLKSDADAFFSTEDAPSMPSFVLPENATYDDIKNTTKDFLKSWNNYCDEGMEYILDRSPVPESAPTFPNTDTIEESAEGLFTAFEKSFERQKRGMEELVKVTLERVVDGDTIVVSLDNQTAYIRLIGINTPESVHPDSDKNTHEGEDASAYLKHFLKDKNYLYLEFDTQLYDKYNRILAYVWLEENTADTNNLLNAKILSDKMAVTMSIEPNVKYKDLFDEIFENSN